MNILGTGLSGLIGTRVVELLGNKHNFINISLESGIDICNFQQVSEIFNSSRADWVFHFAAMTDVDKAESEKQSGVKSQCWRVNVEATENIAYLCQKTGKKLLYLSTDYIFSGSKDKYTENDIPDPVGFYAKTKYEGEIRVRNICPDHIICRISNPYRAQPVGKTDFVNKIMYGLIHGRIIYSPNDQVFTPTFIDDISYALDFLVRKDYRGIIHAVGSQYLTPYDSALLIAEKFSYDRTLIKPVSFQVYFEGRAPRPLRAVISNDKIVSYGVKMTTFNEGLSEIKKQKGNLL